MCGPVQAETLDQRFPKDRLIDALVKRGMTELLEHLVRTDPPQDPAEAEELIYRIHLSRFEDTGLPLEQRQAELKLAEQKIRRSIKSYRDHEARPVWQTDLAGQLLFATLDSENIAGPFYEFAVPTEDQRLLFERCSSEAFIQLAEAAGRLFVLQGELPKQADHVAKRVNTGKWDRLMNRYFAVRVPFYAALASRYVTLLPDEHPFYANLGKPDARMPFRGKTPATERARIIRIALENLEDLADDEDDPHGVRAASLSLRARLLMPAGKLDEAIVALDAIDKIKDVAPVAHLTAGLTRAMILQRQSKGAEALVLIDKLAGLELARNDLLVRLLVVDCRHNLMVAEAARKPKDQQAAAVEHAYAIYDNLLNDPKLVRTAEELRLYVYRRWASGIRPGQDLSQLPSIVLRAAGRLSMEEGDGLLAQALESDDEEGRKSLRAQADERYRRTVHVSSALLARAKLADADKAEARYHATLAAHRMDESDQTTLKCIGAWTDLADQMPGQSVSRLAINHAIDVMRPLHDAAPDDDHRRQLYERITKILFEKFADSAAADRQRVFYAQGTLLPQQRFAEAADALAKVAAREGNEEFYYAAQSDLLFCLGRLYERADDGQRAEVAGRLQARADIVKKQAHRDAANPHATAAVAAAHIAQSTLLIAQGDVEGGVAALREVEKLDVTANVRNAARGDLIGGLVKLGRLSDARDEAKRLMEHAPKDAAPVIYEVLDQIARQTQQARVEAALPDTTRARSKALREQAQVAAGTAVQLSGMLLSWAADQPQFSGGQLANLRLIEARARTVAGMAPAAVEALEKLRADERFSNDLAVLDALGEAQFQAGGGALADAGGRSDAQKAMLMNSASTFDIILAGVEPDREGVYPSQWWRSWMRRLQVNDLLGEGTEDIPFRVRQLRLTDQRLGGEPFRSELLRLENKHQMSAGG